ncbi:protein NODULATION SIGNALING PATHWAY 1-like [Rutidosis leptorrhynchoides]|uniref:protein NODULATION SIGNALING PATHWAY 1-like n=1 Tax=Rutidosis leptorrhynchoides TaxID=125765 RepID=UPI003A9A26AC
MMKQDKFSLPSFPLNTTLMSETMLFNEPDPDMDSAHILNWLEDSMPKLPLILDDLYSSTDINGTNWWVQEPFDAYTFSTSNSIDNVTSTVSSTSDPVVFYDQPHKLVLESDMSKKRKAPEDRMRTPQGKRSSGNKKGTSKSTKDSNNNKHSGNDKNSRWAEQLLNPCATAIANGNVTRVQHLLYVLQELASPTGDANYRLASHGLQALLRHLSSAKAVGPTVTFATSTPKFFQRSLINFNDINPWFTIPNNIANNAILQILSEQEQIHGSCNKTLHILDIGISHGFQWPTLLEALSRKPGGPPPLVRLTVVQPTPDNHQIPFVNCPPCYDFASNILRYANDVNINLQINKLDNCPLQNLNAQTIDSSRDETLIVCAQFRLHNLNHNKPDTRTEFLNVLRSMEPKGVILSDNNMNCSCNKCNKFDTRFSQSLNHLWSFLDSTSVAFKGRDTEERKLLEGEAAKVLTNTFEMNETKEKWGERMRSVGFVETAFADDVVDQARALLKRYDSHWEMRVGEKDGLAGLWWKGQPVSFSSLWK